MAKRTKQFYRRSVLSNGTVVLTERAPGFRTLAVGVFVKGGSRHERPKQAGLAHFLEHMMFKGTEKRSAFEIARDVDLVGGDFNAMTTREYTAFHITLPVHALDFSLELLTDIIRHSRFDPIEIERERQVILQEIAMTEEDPEEWIHDLLFERAYRNHPIGRQILGTIQTVKSFTREDILDYFQRHYYSRNLVITMAGNVNHDAVVRKLERLLGDFRGKKNAPPRESLKKPKVYPGLHVVKRETEQTHLLVACESYPMTHKQRLAAFLLNSFLGGNMSSTLFQTIREQKGYAYSVYSSLANFTDSGLMGMYVGTSPKHAPECLRLIREEIRRIRSQPVNEHDLQVAKNSVKSAIELGSDSMDSRMFALAKSEMFYERQLSDKEISAMVESITPLDVWRACRDLFGDDRWIVLALGDITPQAVKKNFLARDF